MTVAGAVPAGELGMTLMHEHVLIDLTREIRHGGILNDIPISIRELSAFRAWGGRTIVDLTARGMGGDPRALRRISQHTGLHIVLGAGFYRHQYFDASFMDRTSTADLADQITRDLLDGIDDTGVRAGIIGEIGCDEWLTAQEERLFRAAARAHLRTGATISTHAARWPVGTQQLDLLEEEGVPPSRVIVGHSDSVRSVHWDHERDIQAYHLALAQRGAYVEFDNIRELPDRQLDRCAAFVKNLVSHGYGHQVLLSHDVCTQAHLRANGGGGYTLIFERFAAHLARHGIDTDQLREILVDNARSALTGEPSRVS